MDCVAGLEKLLVLMESICDGIIGNALNSPDDDDGPLNPCPVHPRSLVSSVINR